jgi:hypothetical protein
VLRMRRGPGEGPERLDLEGWAPPMLGHPQETRVVLHGTELARFRSEGAFHVSVDIPSQHLPGVGETFDVVLENRDVGSTWNDPRPLGLAVESVRLHSWGS